MAPDAGGYAGPSHQSRLVPARLRRNGTVPSCENCRVAKARCDHNAPCSRCSRQGKMCYFHPSPMSQSRGGASNAGKTRSSSSTSLKSAEQQQSPFNLRAGGSSSYTRKPARLSMGYMGSTSHAAILEENKDARIWNEVCDSADDKSRANSPAAEDENGQDFGISILVRLPPQDIAERMIDSKSGEFEISSFFQPRRVQHYMREFWAQYGRLLREPRQRDNLRQVCMSLNANTKKPLPVPSNNSEWIASFCGPNSRWEVLGEFFTTFGVGVFALPDNARIMTEILQDQMDRKTYACNMLEAADACLMIYDELAFPSNILGATLLSRCLQLQSSIAGDSSYEVWKRIGHFAAATTGLGLHLKANEAESRSSLYHEQRARLFSSAFALDKEIATFMGRPPLLSRRFVSAELPVDVSEDEIWEESDISILRANLDAAGWNTKGHIYQATVVRALILLRHPRDEILEISLSIEMPDDIDTRIESLRIRMEQCYQGFPAVFREPIDRNIFARKSTWDVLCISQTQLFHLQNIFLCERIKHEGRDVQRLLQAARDMLNIVNTFWSGRDRYVQLREVCHWWITCYGIPAASALAMDLWFHTSNPLTWPPTPDRPQVIQNLSVFVTSLDWVDDDCGNYRLCQRIKSLLNDILNRVLSPESASAIQLSQPGFSLWDTNDFSLAGMPNFGTDFNDLDGWVNPPMMN